MKRDAVAAVAVLIVAAYLSTTVWAQSPVTTGAPAAPFDMTRWSTYFLNGRKYYACIPPRCEPEALISFSWERVEGDEAKAVANEQQRQRNIASRVSGRHLLSFTLLSAPDAPGVHVVWRDEPNPPEDRPTFGSLRIVFVSGTRVQVLATSSDVAAAQSGELAISRWIGGPHP